MRAPASVPAVTPMVSVSPPGATAVTTTSSGESGWVRNAQLPTGVCTLSTGSEGALRQDRASTVVVEAGGSRDDTARMHGIGSAVPQGPSV